MRRSDARELFAIMSIGMLMGAGLALGWPAVTVRLVAACAVAGAAGGLLSGAVAICVRIYLEDKGRRRRRSR